MVACLPFTHTGPEAPRVHDLNGNFMFSPTNSSNKPNDPLELTFYHCLNKHPENHLGSTNDTKNIISRIVDVLR